MGPLERPRDPLAQPGRLLQVAPRPADDLPSLVADQVLAALLLEHDVARGLPRPEQIVTIEIEPQVSSLPGSEEDREYARAED